MSAKAATKTKNKYNARVYDSVRLVVKKGEKATLQKHAAEQGESLNSWITGAIKERYRAETGNEEIPRTKEETE